MIQVHVDLAIDPAKEQEMLRYFQTVFRPAAMKFRGYIDVRMLKLQRCAGRHAAARASTIASPSSTRAKSCGRNG